MGTDSHHHLKERINRYYAELVGTDSHHHLKERINRYYAELVETYPGIEDALYRNNRSIYDEDLNITMNNGYLLNKLYIIMITHIPRLILLVEKHKNDIPEAIAISEQWINTSKQHIADVLYLSDADANIQRSMIELVIFFIYFNIFRDILIGLNKIYDTNECS